MYGDQDDYSQRRVSNWPAGLKPCSSPPSRYSSAAARPSCVGGLCNYYYYYYNCLAGHQVGSPCLEAGWHARCHPPHHHHHSLPHHSQPPRPAPTSSAIIAAPAAIDMSAAAPNMTEPVLPEAAANATDIMLADAAAPGATAVEVAPAAPLPKAAPKAAPKAGAVVVIAKPAAPAAPVVADEDAPTTVSGVCAGEPMGGGRGQQRPWGPAELASRGGGRADASPSLEEASGMGGRAGIVR